MPFIPDVCKVCCGDGAAVKECSGDQVYPIEADTLLLTEAALAEVHVGDRVLEIGTGSGYIAATLASRTGITVVATDINPHAAVMAHARGVAAIRTDLASGICGTFDLILCNPPYLPTTAEERMDDWLELALDGGESGRCVIERFAALVPEYLSPCGRILLLISSLTGMEEVFSIFDRRGCRSEVVKSRELEGESLYVLKIIRV